MKKHDPRAMATPISLLMRGSMEEIGRSNSGFFARGPFLTGPLSGPCGNCPVLPFCPLVKAVETRAQIGMPELDEESTDNWGFGMPGDAITGNTVVDFEDSIIGVENHLLMHAAMRTLKDISINKLSVRDFLSEYGEELDPFVREIIEVALSDEEKMAQSSRMITIML